MMIINLTGGKKGGDLSFSVVGGSAEPASPAENTVWVNTDTAITGWIFSHEEPKDQPDGTLWFLLDNDTGRAFNPLKNNAIVLYPAGVMQCMQGIWEKYVAKLYQNGAWITW